MDWQQIYLVLMKITNGDEEQVLEAMSYLMLME